jgi:hypothetical protein
MAKKYDWTDKVNVINRLSVEQLRAAVKLINGDGHTIFDPAAFVKRCGWTEADIVVFTETNKSDLNDVKGIITNRNGDVLNELQGVYGLLLLEAIAKVLNVEYLETLGRGTQAREITDALLKHWNSQKTRTEALEII